MDQSIGIRARVHVRPWALACLGCDIAGVLRLLQRRARRRYLEGAPVARRSRRPSAVKRLIETAPQQVCQSLISVPAAGAVHGRRVARSRVVELVEAGYGTLRATRLGKYPRRTRLAPELSKSCAKAVEQLPRESRFGRAWPKLGRLRPKLARSWPNSARNWPTSAGFGQNLAQLGQFSPTLTNIWPKSVGFWPNSADCACVVRFASPMFSHVRRGRRESEQGAALGPCFGGLVVAAGRPSRPHYRAIPGAMALKDAWRRHLLRHLHTNSAGLVNHVGRASVAEDMPCHFLPHITRDGTLEQNVIAHAMRFDASNEDVIPRGSHMFLESASDEWVQLIDRAPRAASLYHLH